MDMQNAPYLHVGTPELVLGASITSNLFNNPHKLGKRKARRHGGKLRGYSDF